MRTTKQGGKAIFSLYEREALQLRGRNLICVMNLSTFWIQLTRTIRHERFRVFDYDELIQRDKANLDILWLKDGNLGDMENLPSPEALAQEITESLEIALEQFKRVHQELSTSN